MLGSVNPERIFVVFIPLHYTMRCFIFIIIILIAIEFSLGGSSPYSSTDKTNKNNYT